MNRDPRFLLSLLMAGLAFTGISMADDPALPGSGYEASRYELLWSKSPFSVASPEAGADSPDYSLKGIAQFDGVSYAIVLNKQTQEHFTVTTDKPAKGLKLISITLGHDPSGNAANFEKDGQPITLKVDAAPAGGAPNVANNVPPPAPSPAPFVPPNVVPMPGQQPAEVNNRPTFPPGAQPPLATRRPHMIRIPPPPNQPGQPPPAPNSSTP